MHLSNDYVLFVAAVSLNLFGFWLSLSHFIGKEKKKTRRKAKWKILSTTTTTKITDPV